MTPVVQKGRKAAAAAADSLEAITRTLWTVEAGLSAASHAGQAEAELLAADLGCVLVDHLHPAVEALRKAAETAQ